MTKSFELFLEDSIERRVAAFDTEAAKQAARLMSIRKAKGRPGGAKDTMIAGIALAARAALATHNTAHFQDLSIPVVNPWLEPAFSEEVRLTVESYSSPR